MVCVCVCEGEREIEECVCEGERETEVCVRERERQTECGVCVCVCVCVSGCYAPACITLALPKKNTCN